MAQEKIEILFKPKGNQALIRAVKQLDIATKQLKGSVSVYEKEIKKTNKSNKALKGGMLDITTEGRLLNNSFATIRSKMLLASFAAGIFTASIGRLTRLFGEQEAAEKRLSVALGKNANVLNLYASEMQKVTAFGDEEIINAMALIANYTSNEAAIKQLTDSTLDLAAAKGKNLSEAAEMVAKSVFSSTNALQREGVTIEGTAGSVERLESLTSSLSTLYSGQAVAATETFNGSMKDMQDALGDLGENIGEVLAPSILALAGILQSVAEHFDAQKIKNYATAIGGAAFAYGILSGAIVTAAKATVLFFKGNLKTAAIMIAIGAAAEIADRHFNLFSDGTEDLEKELEKLNSTLSDTGSKLNGIGLSEMEGVLKAEIAANNLSLSIDGVGKSEQRLAAVKAEMLFIMTEIKDFRELDERDMARHAGLQLEQHEIEKQIQSEKMQAAVDVFNSLNSIASEYASMETERAENKMAEADAEADSIIEAEKKKRSFQKKSLKQQEAFEAEVRKKAEQSKEAIAKKANKAKAIAFRVDQATAVSAAVMNTSEAYTKALAVPPAPNTVLAGLAAGLGAAQIATILAQKPPKMAKGGIIGGNLHSQGGTIIEAERGEFVMNRDAVDAIGAENLNRMNRGGGGGANITFSGNVMSDDFIENEAIPKIKEAVRRGSDIGAS